MPPKRRFKDAQSSGVIGNRKAAARAAAYLNDESLARLEQRSLARVVQPEPEQQRPSFHLNTPLEAADRTVLEVGEGKPAPSRKAKKFNHSPTSAHASTPSISTCPPRSR